jgi:hypothetical protein
MKRRNTNSHSLSKLARLALTVQAAIFLPILISSFFGCAHTVDSEIIHDTDTVVKKDTIHKVPDGSAFIRFIAFLQKGGTVLLKTVHDGNFTSFGAALPQMTGEFIPIRRDTSLTIYADYYLGPGQPASDSISIPADSLKPYSLHTIALFQSTDSGSSRLLPFFADDSVKGQTPISGKAYLRIINGLPDFPQPIPSVNIYLDDPNGTPVFDTSATYQEIRNYVPIPAGSHIVYVRSTSDPTVLYQTTLKFLEGIFYTSRLNGRKSDNSDTFTIDTE